MNDFQNLITATDVQRNYKMVADRAKSLEDVGLIIMSNTRPDLAIMRFDLYQDLIGRKTKIKEKSKIKEKIGVDAIFGTWTKEEADEFDQIIEETCERIDPEDWK